MQKQIKNMKKVFTLPAIVLLTVGLLTVLLFNSCTSTRRSIGIEEGWELLSEKKVNFVRDKDEITVENRRNKFTAIRFAVEDREVQINELKIYFDNGDKLEPSLDEVIRANQSSRVIELARDGRYIDKIEFKYRTTGNILDGRATVLVFAKRYDPGY
jgi:hypothetical protein